ncbi:MAG: hypothetical protein ACYTE5_03805 [Planctomycetota bacterium]
MKTWQPLATAYSRWFGELFEAARKTVLEDIGYGDHLRWPLGRQCIGRSPRPPATAANQRDLDSVFLGNIGPHSNRASQRHCGQSAGSPFEEFTAGCGYLVSIAMCVHRIILSLL